MNAAHISRVCRFSGVAVLIGSVALLVWTFLAVHDQRVRRLYYDPDSDADTITLVTGYVRVLVSVGLGCALLWLGSRVRARKERGSA